MAFHLFSYLLRFYCCCCFPGSLRGVDIFGETSLTVTAQSQKFQWAGYGIRLHIPSCALPVALEQCRLHIKVTMSGHFAFPENASLVSAVYWLDSKPQCKFSKPITVEIQHCAKPTQCSRLSFVRAKCSQADLPYLFKTLDGGVFTTSSTYGCITLDQFSGVAVTQEGNEDRQYCASLFYLGRAASRQIHFVITWDQEVQTKVSHNFIYSSVSLVLYSWSCICTCYNRKFKKNMLPRVPHLDLISRLSLKWEVYHLMSHLKKNSLGVAGRLFH